MVATCFVCVRYEGNSRFRCDCGIKFHRREVVDVVTDGLESDPDQHFADMFGTWPRPSMACREFCTSETENTA
jgi:hypothetical protein